MNSFFVVVLAPVFAWLWTSLAKRGIDAVEPREVLGRTVLRRPRLPDHGPPRARVVASGGVLKVSMLWLTISYILQTFGELSLSPVGLSSMTKLAPDKFGGQMMGIWFLARRSAT